MERIGCTGTVGNCNRTSMVDNRTGMVDNRTNMVDNRKHTAGNRKSTVGMMAGSCRDSWHAQSNRALGQLQELQVQLQERPEP